MKLEIYQPNSGRSTDSAFILPNRLVGAHNDDLGVRARLLANYIKCDVLAYERPGTATAENIKAFSPETLMIDIARRAEILGNVIASCGYDSIFAGGHSAAASEAILLTSVGTLGIKKLVALDPVMMQRHAGIRKYNAWLREQLFHKYEDIEFFADIEPWPEQQVEISAREAFTRTHKERKTYGACFWSDMALESLKAMPATVETNLYLAGSSDIAPAKAIIVNFANHPTIVTHIVPGGHHSFAEPYGNHNELIGRHIST